MQGVSYWGNFYLFSYVLLTPRTEKNEKKDFPFFQIFSFRFEDIQRKYRIFAPQKNNKNNSFFIGM
jgi:hypothetical protein